MKRARIVFCLSLGASACLTGCNLAPKYARPEAPVPAEWPASPSAQPTTQASDAALVGWREFFTDPKLQRIIETALRNNRDLRLAALNVQRAQGLYGIQQANLLPTADASGTLRRQRVPADLARSAKATTASEYSVGLGMTAWEIDFFGRIRNLADQALQEYLATEQARRSAQILLLSSIANAYLTIASDREGLKLARDTLANQQGMYELIKKQLKQGVISEVDLYRAQTQVESARRDVAQFTQLVAQDVNALNYLVGSSVSADLLPADLGHVGVIGEASAGRPSEVLLSRPDILAAEDHLKAANANIGAARAAFFPRISLTAAAGTASAELSSLFNGGQGTWTYAPQMVLPIFDAPPLAGAEGEQGGYANRHHPIRTGHPDGVPRSGRCPWRSATRSASRSRHNRRWSTRIPKPIGCPSPGTTGDSTATSPCSTRNGLSTPRRWA